MFYLINYSGTINSESFSVQCGRKSRHEVAEPVLDVVEHFSRTNIAIAHLEHRKSYNYILILTFIPLKERIRCTL